MKERNWNKNLKSQELCDFIATKLNESPSDIFVARIYQNNGVYGGNGSFAFCFKDIASLETMLESISQAYDMGCIGEYTTISIKSYENYGTVAEYQEDIWGEENEYKWSLERGKRL